MLKALLARLKQKYRTSKFPKKEPELSNRFRGCPKIHTNSCQGCHACIESCPTDAIAKNNDSISIDLGKCIFCQKCTKTCPKNAITFTNDYRLATRSREDLILSKEALSLAESLQKETKRIFGRSLRLREVSAGGCAGCELDTNVLQTLVFDLSRFGIQFVASPRHADGLFITGPVSKNMELALKKTYDALAKPNIIIACGSCAIEGGPYIGHEEVLQGVDKLLPVDLYIPGCPPHPYTILDGLLRILGKR